MASPKPYSRRFREAAIAQVRRDTPGSIRSVAVSFGVSESTLRRWLRDADNSSAGTHPAENPTEEVTSTPPSTSAPNVSFGGLYPEVDYSALLPKVDYSALLPKVDYSALLPKVDYSALLPKVDYSALLPKVDFSALMPRIDFDRLIRIAEDYRELLPPNWDGNVPEWSRMVEVLTEDGIPLTWVPRSTIVHELLSATTRDDRLAVLTVHRDLVLDDCRSVLSDVVHSRLIGQQPLALRAVEALVQGHIEAAQALAVVVTETAVSRALGSYAKVKKRVLLNHDAEAVKDVRRSTALAPIGTFYTAWRPSDQTPPPTVLSRHVTVHNAQTDHYTLANSIVAVMLMSSVLRALDDHWTDAEPEF